MIGKLSLRKLIPLSPAAVMLLMAAYLLWRDIPPEQPYIAQEELSAEVFDDTGVELITHRSLKTLSEFASMNPNSEPVLGEVVPKAQWILAQEMLKYPKSVIQDGLKAVYLYHRIRLFDVSFAGTVSQRSIFLATGPLNRLAEEQFFRESFHHEFSSLLLHQHDFPWEEWMKAIPKGFRYLSETEEALNKELEAIEAGWTEERPKHLLEQGILHAYGRTNPENDFNLYAELLMTRPEMIQEWSSEYPRIRAKCELVVRFYLSLDPSWDLPQCDA